MTAKHAAAYLRRSSVSADSPGEASREAQAAATSRLAAAFAAGMPVVEYVDWGISGRKDDRAEYVRLKRAIAAGEVCCVFAYSLSRLGRTARELDSLFTLCEAHGVQVITEADGTLTATSATGKFLRRILAELAELESELAKERGASAREARVERHRAAGAKLLGSRPIYGELHVTNNEDGKAITRAIPDPMRSIGPVIDAYREAGSVRGACALLAGEAGKPVTHGVTGRVIGIGKGITPPEGGKTWGVSTLTRILEHYIPDELPNENAKGSRRPVMSAALFAGLVRCHCGRAMTPNVKRGQYYCAAGRDSGTGTHGRYNVTEKALLAVLASEAERYDQQVNLNARDITQVERAAIEQKMKNLDTRLEVGRIDRAEYKQRMVALQADLAKLGQADRTLASFQMEAIPAWSDVPAMNKHLRRLWTSVQLDEAMTPTVEWGIPAYFYDDEVRAAYEAEERERS